jgi:DNA polymerase-3 subunit epsilon
MRDFMSAKSVSANKSLNFVAIDFETANSKRSSACAVGLVRVIDGQVAESHRLYIRPEPFFFDPFNVAIHGIKEADVKDAPRFSELWPELRTKLVAPLVAHNAAFDMSVLRHSLDEAGIEYPEVDYFCTRVISRVTWPGRPTYALDYVAEMLGISFAHHDAEEDARACASVAVAACEQLHAESLYSLEKRVEIWKGSLFPGGYLPCGTSQPFHSRSASDRQVRASDITATVRKIDASHPFYRKAFVFTGTMMSMSRSQAMQEAVNHGGICQDSVNSTTNFLVLGEKGYRGYRSGFKSNKMKKAEALIQQGLLVEILSEPDFLALL